MKKISELNKGDLIKFPNKNLVWVYVGYNRIGKTYMFTKYDDINASCHIRNKEQAVNIDFTS